MTPGEARLGIHEAIVDLLVDLGSEDPDIGEEELNALAESYADIADLIFEVLDVKVLSTDGDRATLSVRVPPEA